MKGSGENAVMIDAMRLVLSSWIRLYVVVAMAALGVCSPVAAQDSIVVVGSGSTVPDPLYKKWAEEFNRRNPRVQFRYLPLGTSESIRLVSKGSGEFGAGEVQLSTKELSDLRLTLVPTVLVAIVPIYNLPGVSGEVRFSGEALAEIYLGKISKWNDAALARVNPTLNLPNVAIKVVYRPAGKGSNFIFSDYLSKVSPAFRTSVGRSASPKWPVGVAAERSSDMADKVKSETGSIGYVELSYAIKARIDYGAVQNASGHYVKASRDSLLAACTALLKSVPDNFSVSLTNAPGENSYPLTSLTWLYLPAHPSTAARGAATTELVQWMLGEGQTLAHLEGYTELPPPLLAKVKARLMANASAASH
jgi:phosphate transport system substrate-binding protein